MDKFNAFTKKVSEMRGAQRLLKLYRTKSQQTRVEGLEREVDSMLKEFERDQGKVEQLRLDAGSDHKTDETPGSYNTRSK